MIDCCVRRQPRNLMKARRTEVLKPTWLQKADEPTSALPPGAQQDSTQTGATTAYEWLHNLADETSAHVKDAFLDAVKDHMQSSINFVALQAALDAGDVAAVMAVLDIERHLGIIHPAVLKDLESLVHRAGAEAINRTPALAERGGQLAMRFDMVNPHTVQQVRTYGFNLIQQITDDTRNGIRQIVADAMEYGGHPYEQARQIKGLIGLTENQAAAVGNFRRLLTAGDSRALTRELRDHRFDGLLRRTLGNNPASNLTQEQIDTMVQRYGDRMLTMRAENIARTETINAARIGTQNAWVQATEHGLLNRSTLRQGWLVTPDDRLCIYCSEVPDMNPDGVKLGESFQTPLGPVDGPGLHPSCRCVVYIMTL